MSLRESAFELYLIQDGSIRLFPRLASDGKIDIYLSASFVYKENKISLHSGVLNPAATSTADIFLIQPNGYRDSVYFSIPTEAAQATWLSSELVDRYKYIRQIFLDLVKKIGTPEEIAEEMRNTLSTHVINDIASKQAWYDDMYTRWQDVPDESILEFVKEYYDHEEPEEEDND